MRSQVGDTSHSIALDLHIGAEHLPDERLKATELYDEQLVIGYEMPSARMSKRHA